MEARTNRTEARISCSPPAPRKGKCADSIQSSSGIMAMRLSVMELGRFMLLLPGHSVCSASLSHCGKETKCGQSVPVPDSSGLYQNKTESRSREWAMDSIPMPDRDADEDFSASATPYQIR